jgi:hypothetical protein
VLLANNYYQVFDKITAQINMNERQQSFLLNAIKTHIKNGGNMTHILNVKFSNLPTAETRNCIIIREAMCSAIGNM